LPLCVPSVFHFLFHKKREKALIFLSQNPPSPKGTYISLGRKPIACMLACSGGARDKMGLGGGGSWTFFFLESRKNPASVTIYMSSLTSQPWACMNKISRHHRKVLYGWQWLAYPGD
jgi:hypothetical protein